MVHRLHLRQGNRRAKLPTPPANVALRLCENPGTSKTTCVTRDMWTIDMRTWSRVLDGETQMSSKPMFIEFLAPTVQRWNLLSLQHTFTRYEKVRTSEKSLWWFSLHKPSDTNTFHCDRGFGACKSFRFSSWYTRSPVTLLVERCFVTCHMQKYSHSLQHELLVRLQNMLSFEVEMANHIHSFASYQPITSSGFAFQWYPLVWNEWMWLVNSINRESVHKPSRRTRSSLLLWFFRKSWGIFRKLWQIIS